MSNNNVNTIYYYKDGIISSKHYGGKILHRIGGPAVERASGIREWYVDGKLHRVDGPATEFPDGTKCWYVNDTCHRTDGPAIEWFNGDREWWIDGEEYAEYDFNKLIKEVDEMSLIMKLTDPRWWVRELGEREVG
jgi:hypothetical protein